MQKNCSDISKAAQAKSLDLVRQAKGFIVLLAAFATLFIQNRPVAADQESDQLLATFNRQGDEFLKSNCSKCHGNERAEADLKLQLPKDLKDVSKQRKIWEKVLKMVRSGEMPPSEAKQPTLEESTSFVELLSTLIDCADRNADPDPGRVTMRRLNRVEYQNTVRDLVGIDFDPTENFPADDIGHGFDNIGDVLSLPPILMERYLEAAESVMSRAILPNPPKPTVRRVDLRYAEPAGAEVEKEQMSDKFRWISSSAEKPIASGPIHSPIRFEDDGEYTFKVKVYASTESDQPVRMALMVQGEKLAEASSDEELSKLVGKVNGRAKIESIVTVEARSKEKAQEIEIVLAPSSGRERAMIALLKPEEGQPEVKLYAQYFVLQGPTDMRPASQRRLLDTAENLTVEQKTEEALRRFLRKAFRRPATTDELARYVKYVTTVCEDGTQWEVAMQTALQAVLCSPKFLFRVELDDRPTSPEARAIDEFHLASRLSYFLWCSMPDDELLDLAEKQQLTSNLSAQIDRMLADSRSKSLVDNFAMQWLQLQRLRTAAPDPKMFPSFTPQLREAMMTETKMFVESIIREDRSILELIDADFTYLNSTLARHYGLSDLLSSGNGGRRGRSRDGNEPFEKVSLKDRKRGGLLTQASMLTVTSNPTRTSPVKRGRWVLEQILGEPPPPPPPDVPELPNDDKAAATGSLRQRLEIHRQNPSCANCHAKMDPIGFALENFDAIGAFRTKDGEFDVDASGSFADGSKFAGPEDLKQIIQSKHQEFTRCLTEKLLTYALGRGVEYYDRPTVERIVKQTSSAQYQFSTLVKEIVTSDAFRMRRGLESLESE